jgi:phosphatidate cytidylyltransferase
MRSTRVLTAILLIPVVVAAIWWGPAWFVALLVAGVILLSLREFFDLGEKIGLAGYRLWTMICSVGLVFSQWEGTRWRSDYIPYQIRLFGFDIGLDLVLFIFVLGAGAIAIFRPARIAQSFGSISVSAAGLLVVAMPLSYIVRLKGPDGHGYPLLILLSLIWVGDSAAYFVGSALGKRPLAPVISPKKTWEGAIANFLGSIIVAAAIGWAMNFWENTGWISVMHLSVMGAIISVAGQIGDLAESVYKRSAGVKDSGAILPGHGGMLDRVDSLIFAAPALWYYIQIAGSL